ncbi:MAG: phenylacetate--CoA ligase family protein [Deltaproteobacteria bacterium]|nr:phenylacetate--CoA ligase family protein [Candidatus Anaeroferrophillus wilburensis]MBN2887906.1 phenylacetate--CoA ligase family protein [Deltaproteobacteria bacterium]
MNPSEKTTLARELQQQSRWRLRPQCAGMTIFDTLLKNEFLLQEEQDRRHWQAVQQILRYCSRKIPYYKQLFKEAGMRRFDVDRPDDLQKIPPLTKLLLQECKDYLTPASLPRDDVVQWLTKTSGSTGQPVEVLHTRKSGQMFGFLRQREGPYFETAPFYGFYRGNPIEKQKQWLAKIRPAYLIAQAADLEQLALAYQGEEIPTSLKGLHAIAQELTSEMQERIERTFNLSVHQSYGLNEIGLVAAYCPEGGCYHVHVEHCYVEIVDDDGRPCGPGQRGRILVTALNNAAMPLLRYDTGDLAQVVAGPCPCGRTLPSFGRIHGRYRRLASLPPGTMERFAALSKALIAMSEDISKNLRQYQLHQDKEKNFTLRVAAAAPLPGEFFAQLMVRWQEFGSGNVPALRITVMDRIPRPPGGNIRILPRSSCRFPGNHDILIVGNHPWMLRCYFVVFDDGGRYANRSNVIGNILGNYGTGTDNGIATNSFFWQDGCASADITTFFEMCSSTDGYSRADVDIVLNGNIVTDDAA